MKTQHLKIRRATTGHAGLIAAPGARTFEDSFGADNHPEDMEQYLSHSFSEAHIEAQLAVPGCNPDELVRIYVEPGNGAVNLILPPIHQGMGVK